MRCSRLRLDLLGHKPKPRKPLVRHAGLRQPIKGSPIPASSERGALSTGTLTDRRTFEGLKPRHPTSHKRHHPVPGRNLSKLQ
jgi:hypothetical protein